MLINQRDYSISQLNLILLAAPCRMIDPVCGSPGVMFDLEMG
jgi:hypothetical protein